MKYEYEYKRTETREEFISVLLRNYKNIKRQTVERRYRHLRSIFGKQRKISQFEEKFEEKNVDITDNVKKPTPLKMLEFKDMKKFKVRMSDDYLRKHGFTFEDINWLKVQEWI